VAIVIINIGVNYWCFMGFKNGHFYKLNGKMELF